MASGTGCARKKAVFVGWRVSTARSSTPIAPRKFPIGRRRSFFRGAATTNSNSCASGTIAVGEALRYIRDDFADVIVAGGAESPLSQLTFGAFAFIKTMSQFTGDPAKSCRPFDKLRDGFVMGEG